MYTPAVEECSAEISSYALARQYRVEVENLDKRVRAIEEVFECPRSNLTYARKQAMKLHTKCVAAGRGDLAERLVFVVNNPVYEERRKARAEAIKQAKSKFADAMMRA